MIHDEISSHTAFPSSHFRIFGNKSPKFSARVNEQQVIWESKREFLLVDCTFLTYSVENKDDDNNEEEVKILRNVPRCFRCDEEWGSERWNERAKEKRSFWKSLFLLSLKEEIRATLSLHAKMLIIYFSDFFFLVG